MTENLEKKLYAPRTKRAILIPSSSMYTQIPSDRGIIIENPEPFGYSNVVYSAKYGLLIRIK